MRTWVTSRRRLELSESLFNLRSNSPNWPGAPRSVLAGESFPSTDDVRQLSVDAGLLQSAYYFIIFFSF